MRSLTKSAPVAITRAKKTSTDGKVTYYYSKPHISPFDLRGWAWYARSMWAFKREERNERRKS